MEWLTIARVQEMLSRFTYKPNMSFYCYERGGQIWIKISMYVENSRENFSSWQVENERYENDFMYGVYNKPVALKPLFYSPRRPLVPVDGNFIVPPYIESEDSFWHWLRAFPLTELEMHERDEWFKVDKQVVFDPHVKEKIL